MIDENIRKKVIDIFGVDVVDEILLTDDYHIVFCFDYNKLAESELFILSGNIEYYGIEKADHLYVKDLLPYIEYNNPVSYVIGKDKYLDYLFKLIDYSKSDSDVYFPFRVNGELVWVVCTFHTIKKDNNFRLVFGRVNWMTNKMPDAVKYYQNKYIDMLTGLYSAEALRYHLRQADESSLSYGLYFDIDNFKRINDVFGHMKGDKYLRELGQKFLFSEKYNKHYYRLGGDEFFVYLVDSTEKEAYKTALQIIYDVEKLNQEGEQVEVSASIGIIPIKGSNFKVEDLLDLADKAMYHAKGRGKGNISYARDV